jgi:uncharacterized membrane protein YcaP (DUF421 family)
MLRCFQILHLDFRGNLIRSHNSRKIYKMYMFLISSIMGQILKHTLNGLVPILAQCNLTIIQNGKFTKQCLQHFLYSFNQIMEKLVLHCGVLTKK